MPLRPNPPRAVARRAPPFPAPAPLTWAAWPCRPQTQRPLHAGRMWWWRGAPVAAAILLTGGATPCRAAARSPCELDPHGSRAVTSWCWRARACPTCGSAKATGAQGHTRMLPRPAGRRAREPPPHGWLAPERGMAGRVSPASRSGRWGEEVIYGDATFLVACGAGGSRGEKATAGGGNGCVASTSDFFFF